VALGYLRSSSVLQVMETADVTGLIIFVGMVGAYTFILLGCLERRLKKVDRVIKQVEDDAKYVS